MAKTRNFKEFYAVLNQHVKVSGLDAKELKEQFVGEASNGRTTSAKELTDFEFVALIGAMRAKLGSGRDATADVWRKRVIAAGCEYYKLMRLYQDLSDAERIEKVKGMAVKAKGGKVRFNALSIGDLQALYNGCLSKNNILRASNKQFADDLKQNAQ